VVFGGPTARKVDRPSGTGWPRSERRQAERPRKTGTTETRLSPSRVSDNRPDTDFVRLERALTWPGEPVDDPKSASAGTEGQVGHHDRDPDRDGRCCARRRDRRGQRERTGGRGPRLVVDRLATGRERRTAFAAAHLHGVAERGPEEGPELAEVDAAIPLKRSAERAAGRGDQRRAQDGGGSTARPRCWPPRKPNWPTGCSSGRPGGHLDRSSACTSRRPTGNGAHSGSQ
jgi:hypothetical protein